MGSKTLSIYFFFLIFWEIRQSIACAEPRKYEQNGEIKSYFPSNRSLEDIYGLTSSRTVLAEHVFRGSFLSYNERIIPRAIIASFRLKLFYKNRFGPLGNQERLIWVVDRTYRDTYHCFKYMSKNRDYVVYLNGTALWVTSGGMTKNYYWISSKPQPATRTRVKKVVEFSCSDCPAKPSMKLSYSKKSTDGTTSLHLTCLSTSECKLPVKSFWFKDRKLIQGSENNELVRVHVYRDDETSTEQPNSDLTTYSPKDVTTSNYDKFKIYTSHHYSVLIVNDLENDFDNGTYRCLMMNVVGERSEDFVWPITVTTTTTTTTTKSTPDHTEVQRWTPCSDDYYCLYKGQCLIIQITGDTICRCYEGYYGNHCQFSVDEGPRTGPTLDRASQTISAFISILTFFIFLLLIAVFCLVRAFESLKKEIFLLRERSLRPESIPIDTNIFEPKEIVIETENPILSLPETSATPNQYVESEEMLSSIHPMVAPDKPSSGRSIRRAFTHYFFGPSSTPPFKVKSPTFNGMYVEKPQSKDKKLLKSNYLPRVTPKSSSSPSQLSKPPDDADNKDLELHNYINSASKKSQIT